MKWSSRYPICCVQHIDVAGISQWETLLYCNHVSHWLGAHLDWSLMLWQTEEIVWMKLPGILVTKILGEYHDIMISWWYNHMILLSTLLKTSVRLFYYREDSNAKLWCFVFYFPVRFTAVTFTKLIEARYLSEPMLTKFHETTWHHY